MDKELYFGEEKRINDLVKKVERERFPELLERVIVLRKYNSEDPLSADGSTIYWNPEILQYEDKALEGAIGHELAHISKGHCKWYNALVSRLSYKTYLKREVEANDEVVWRGLGENLHLFYTSRKKDKTLVEKSIKYVGKNINRKVILGWRLGKQIALTIVLDKDKVRVVNSQGRKKKFWWVG